MAFGMTNGTGVLLMKDTITGYYDTLKNINNSQLCLAFDYTEIHCHLFILNLESCVRPLGTLSLCFFPSVFSTSSVCLLETTVSFE
jgi:hypothetical protein